MLKTAGAAVGALIAIAFLVAIATHLAPHTPKDPDTRVALSRR